MENNNLKMNNKGCRQPRTEPTLPGTSLSGAERLMARGGNVSAMCAVFSK